MSELTWLGWIFVIDAGLSIPLWLYRASNGVYVREPSESVVLAFVTTLYLIGFFTIGFTH